MGRFPSELREVPPHEIALLEAMLLYQWERQSLAVARQKFDAGKMEELTDDDMELLREYAEEVA